MSSPSSLATAAITKDVGAQAPGWEFKALVNGADYADAPSGSARIPVPPNAGLAMTNDTIIHVASMSKPVCAAAYVAMLEDWTDLANGVSGTGPLAATIAVAIHSGPPPTQPQPVSLVGTQIPLWLVPALFSAPLAAALLKVGLWNIVPQALQATVSAVASNTAWCSMVGVVPPIGVGTSRAPVVPAEIQPLPGYVGLLTRIIEGVLAPQPSECFLLFTQGNLQAKAAALGVPYQVGAGMGSVTIGQIVTHTSAIPNGFLSTNIVNPILAPYTAFTQPANGGPVTVQPTNSGPVLFDIWAYLLAFVSQPANYQTGYKNDDYNILGGVVAACVGMDYDDYVYARLFSDPQFGALRRYVTDVPNSAWYYTGTAPNFSVGNPFPNYLGFGACGGFYYTANQITQWMYTLYSGANVRRATGAGASGPLVSPASLKNILFGTTGYFSSGYTTPAGNSPPASGWITYPHNGGTPVGTGQCNGEMAVAVGPKGDVMTAFFCANGSLNADVPFNDALNAIVP